jgi:hypothetical protein
LANFLSSSSEGLPTLSGFHIWTMITWLFLVSSVLKLDAMMYTL